jgi:hypothetical protein
MRGSAVFAAAGLNIKPGVRLKINALCLKINLKVADRSKNQLTLSKYQTW